MKTTCGEPGLNLNRFVRSLQDNRGFTLIELLVVVAIIGVLSTMVSTLFVEFRDKTRVARSAEEIRGLEKDIIAFASEKGSFPLDLAEVGRSGQKDPWGNLYVYYPILLTAIPAVTSRGNLNSDFDLYSWGANKLSPASIADPDSDDDIIRAGDGSYTGTVIRYGL
jgi:prepilin-type N-terminal cleavage/methylation domain-containing protein